jgi:iron complex transport system substrate-binding protein
MRIVSLVPHATELLFALGAGAEVVAVTHECDYPPQALERARVTSDALPAGMGAREIDAAVRARTLAGESIYELDRAALARSEPDLIVTQALCPVCAVSYEDVAAIAEELPTHPRVIALDPSTLGETQTDVRTLAAATGRAEEGARLLERAAARIEALQRAVRSRKRRRALALEWLDPAYVAGHWTPHMVRLAGGTDVAGRPGEPSEVVAWETLQALRPQVVVVMPCGYDAGHAHAEAIAHAEELARLGAERVVAVDASAYFSRPGPRLIDGLELLGHILHPDVLPQPPQGAQALEVELGAES